MSDKLFKKVPCPECGSKKNGGGHTSSGKQYGCKDCGHTWKYE